jgi:predicted transcriptional regulator
MDPYIPSAADLRALLLALGHAQMQQMAQRSGVPFTTLWKLRSGETDNPRLETVRSLLPHLLNAEAA